MEYMEPWKTSANWELGWTRKPATCKTEIQVRRELGNQETHEQEKNQETKEFWGEMWTSSARTGSWKQWTRKPKEKGKQKNKRKLEIWETREGGELKSGKLENGS